MDVKLLFTKTVKIKNIVKYIVGTVGTLEIKDFLISDKNNDICVYVTINDVF